MSQVRKRSSLMALFIIIKSKLGSLVESFSSSKETEIVYGRWTVEVSTDFNKIRYGFKQCTGKSKSFPFTAVNDKFVTIEKNKEHAELHQVREGYLSDESCELADKIISSIEAIKCGSCNEDDITNANYIAEAIIRDRKRFGVGWMTLSQRKNFK